MKKCLKCLNSYHEIYFGPHGRNKGKKQIWCRECVKKYNEEYYLRHAESEKSRKKRQRAERSKVLLKVKATNPCHCGEDEPLALQLFPLEVDVPKYTISTSLGKAIDALNRSAVVCYNCRIKIDAGLTPAPRRALRWDVKELEPPPPKAHEPKKERTPALPPGVSPGEVPGEAGRHKEKQ